MKYLIIAQLNPTVGDIPGNLSLIRQTLHKVRSQYPNAVVIFPEMMISGYCPQDLLLRPDFIQQCQQGVLDLCPDTKNLCVILGSPYLINDDEGNFSITNAAIVYQDEKILTTYAKQQLPNYSIFDEKRYFTTQKNPAIIRYQNKSIGLLVCEDGWKKESYQYFKNENMDLIISINASPFEQHKPEQRIEIGQDIYQTTQTPLVYANLFGGQDELVFDGNSFIINAPQDISYLPQFQSGAFVLEADWQAENSEHSLTTTLVKKITIEHSNATEFLPLIHHREGPLENLTQVYSALQLGLRDYVKKNKFQKVILGLSGGLDSALTCAIAVDALGADKVIAVMLSSPYTSALSIDLFNQQADLLNIEHYHIKLSDTIDSVENKLLPIWKNLPDNQAISRQNIHARLRGLILMALSNEYNALLLATGNKSELAVGYATMYGDMAGGFSPIKDVYKTLVYQLSDYRNAISPAIPQQVITRPPTAELAPDQKDTDTLPEYPVLDAIIEAFVEKKYSTEQIINQGYDAATVRRITKLILKNQHKRQQASIGTKITTVAFGRDFRYPNTQQWQ
jgi:NAD+ synthase (glutamine-hydrolysing)